MKFETETVKQSPPMGWTYSVPIKWTWQIGPEKDENYSSCVADTLCFTDGQLVFTTEGAPVMLVASGYWSCVWPEDDGEPA